MKVRFTDSAGVDIDQAWNWYSARSTEAADRLLDDVIAARNLIGEYPRAWKHLGNNVRLCQLERYPYGLVYIVAFEEIVVAGLGHLRRGPAHWNALVRRPQK